MPIACLRAVDADADVVADVVAGAADVDAADVVGVVAHAHSVFAGI